MFEYGDQRMKRVPLQERAAVAVSGYPSSTALPQCAFARHTLMAFYECEGIGRYVF